MLGIRSVRRILAFWMGLSALAFAQLTIEGAVTDEHGNPLVGANLVVKGTPLGTIVDLSGRYTLLIPQPAAETVLEVSYIGYGTQSQTITQTSGVVETNFTLSVDVLQFDEVVVTGVSAATTRRQLGNAIATVRAEEIGVSGSPAIDRALAGKIAGALVQQNSGNPAGGITIRLRGTATVLGDADPLYIIDGVIVNNASPILIRLGGGAQNRLVDINPADIERIEVVKGAAAAALYGSRANNGVVQIFTKRGVYGAPRITVSTRFISDAIRKTLKVNTYPYDKRFDDPDRKEVERYDHQDLIFQQAYGTENYISVAGGGGDTRYYSSASYFSNDGIVRGSSFQRASTRVRLDQVLNSWASLSTGANYTLSRSQDIPNGGLVGNYGSMTGFIFGPNTYDAAPDETGSYSDDGILANPAEVIDKYDFTQTTSRFIGDAHLTLTPFEGLGIDYTLGYDTYAQTALGFIPIGTSSPGYPNGFSRRATRDFLQINNDLNVRYQANLSGLASTTLMGVTMQYERVSTFAVEAKDMALIVRTVEGGATQVVGDIRDEQVLYGVFAQETFGLGDRLFVTGAARLDASSVFGEEERRQFYPKASASYLLSEESFWKNSALAGLVPNFKLRASWGQSGGLTAISPFTRFTNYSPLSYMGNSGLLPSTTLGSLDIKPERQTETEFGADVGLLGNRLGLEFTAYFQHVNNLLLTRQVAPSTGFLNKLQNVGEMDNKGIELLVRAIPVDKPDFRWLTSLTYSRNKNKVDGIEGGIMIIPESFGLVAAINGQPLGVFYGAAYDRDENGDILAKWEDTDGSLKDYTWNADGDITSVDGDGNAVTSVLYTDSKTQLPARRQSNWPDLIAIDGEDTVWSAKNIIGDPNPDFIASWINEIELGRNLSLRTQIDIVSGQDVINFTRRLAALGAFGTLEDYQKELEGELAEGHNSAVFSTFEHWVEDGSFIKLREVSLSYRLKPQVLGLSGLRIDLIGRNLFSLDDYSGYDPETNIGGQRTVVRGFDFVEVPLPRSISLGITANF